MKKVIFNGKSFTLASNGRYYYNSRLRKSLHQVVWEYYNGEIPKGYHVHHIDHDGLNNDISNLKLMEEKEHLKYHADLQDKEKLREHAEKIREKAIEWHKSTKGREWHKEHYEKMKDKLHVEIELVCQECGKTYKTTKHDSKFCSNKCRTKHRRKSGIDNETRICKHCGKEFVVNKYSKSQYCSISCGRKDYWKNHLKDSPTLQE